MARCSFIVRSKARGSVIPRQTRARAVGSDMLSTSDASTELPEPCAILRWNSRSVATKSSTGELTETESSILPSSALSWSVIRSAARPVAEGSRMRRTSRNSSTVSSRWKSTMKLSASSSSEGARLVAYVPSPWRTSSTLIRLSAFTASRSELRDKPSSAARSASLGSFSPGRTRPERIICLILSIASSVSGTNRSRRRRCPFRARSSCKALLVSGSKGLPQFRRYVKPAQRDRVGDLRRAARADQHTRDRRVRQREARGRGAQRHPGLRADFLQPQRAADQGAGCGRVVIGGIRSRRGEQAGVEHASGDDRRAALQGGGQQLVRGGLVEQRVPAGDEDHVDVGLADEPGEHLGLVHADADRADNAFRAQPLECGVRLAQCLLPVRIGGVDERDVDPVKAESVQARRQAPPDAVGAEVEPPDEAGRNVKPLVVAPDARAGPG